MLDIPILAKDALREGSYKKNFKFTVQREVTTRNITYFTTLNSGNRTYTVGRNVMIYYHIGASEPTATIRGVVNFPDSGYLPLEIEHTYGTEDFEPLGGFLVGSVIDFSFQLSTFPNIDLTSEDLITETTTWVDDFLIDNDTLVSESVNFDEAMCSDKQLKFGLCEGTSLEFQYFDHPNINGRRIKAEIQVYYPANGSLTSTTIPMGYFMVDACPMQASTGIYKVTAYNKLKSEYLDAKANTLIEDNFGFEESVLLFDIINILLGEYKIKKDDYNYIPSQSVSQGYKSTRPAGSGNTTPFSPYKYTSWYGDQGPLGPWTMKKHWSPTLSSNFYMEGDVYVRKFDISSYTNPVQVRFDIDFDAIDYAIANNIKMYLAKMSINITVDELWNRIKGMRYGNAGDAYYLDNYFFCVRVVYKNDDVDYYGNFAENAKGTFADLAKISLINVKSIWLLQPARLWFGYSLLDGYINNTVTIEGERDNIYLFGEDQSYIYMTADGGTEVSATYTTPKKPDGSDIDTMVNYMHVSEVTGITPAELIEIPSTALADVTLRELQSAVFELNCQYGQIDRVTDLFYGKDLGSNALYPDDVLYPDNALYPSGTRESGFRAQYSKMWTDTQGEQTFRYLIITYKGLDEEGQEREYKLQRTVNADGTTDYNMSDNWIFKNMVWTAVQVGEYADAMVAKMQSVRWFPFEMWLAGLPYIETGDELEIIIGENTYTSYVLRRTLKGIQNLQDTYINGTLDIF